MADFLDGSDAPLPLYLSYFVAQITAVTGTTPHVYSWKEQFPDPAGTGFVDADGARVGTTTDGAAYELNNAGVSVGTNVFMRVRGIAHGGQLLYEFDQSAPAGGAVEVKQASGTPDVTGVTLLILDQATGLAIETSGGGSVTLELLAASPTQQGAVSTGTQAFAGLKEFASPVLFDQGLTCVTGSGASINTDSYSLTKGLINLGIDGVLDQGYLKWTGGTSAGETMLWVGPIGNWSLLGGSGEAGWIAALYSLDRATTDSAAFMLGRNSFHFIGVGHTGAFSGPTGKVEWANGTGGTIVKTCQYGTLADGSEVTMGLITAIGTGGSSAITVGTTPVSGGSSGDLLRISGGVVSSVSQVPVTNGGTGSDLSATGGPGDVLRQSTPGGAVTVGPAPAPPIATQVLWGVD